MSKQNCKLKIGLSCDETESWLTNEGGGDSLIKVGMNVRTRALGISGVNFCPGIRFWEVNSAQALGFWQVLTNK